MYKRPATPNILYSERTHDCTSYSLTYTLRNGKDQTPDSNTSLFMNDPLTQAQTPQQRRANEAFARAESAKRGKPQSEIKKKAEKKEKPPISKGWLCTHRLHRVWTG